MEKGANSQRETNCSKTLPGSQPGCVGIGHLMFSSPQKQCFCHCYHLFHSSIGKTLLSLQICFLKGFITLPLVPFSVGVIPGHRAGVWPRCTQWSPLVLAVSHLLGRRCHPLQTPLHHCTPGRRMNSRREKPRKAICEALLLCHY